ncbi:MAG: hypothetical protein OMM_02953 [Candidatus Magnetoglobus multicellularis str. Araruama]|uniref:Uncharacterized protein n=1 Tax=Candidatus Magnetoglobus multicellularis str. Araruama TaxID=890399 RepID=A0A1V1P7G2_9BACT|nr:MAG: hypothetical protein OMM_02953 [Candidatus Magnetoglobus multicellularis str. Araruama]
MSTTNSLMRLIQKNKRLFVIIGICLFLLEMEIFAVAILKSGNQSKIVVLNDQNNVIYEANGSNLTDFNKYYFEKNFGPLDQYEVKLQSKHVPFPFRAWFSAAFGIPVGIVLLVAFVLKAIATLLGEDKPSGAKKTDSKDAHETAFEGLLHRLSEINIFVIGAVAFLCVLAYWIIPNFITYIGEIGTHAILKFKWFFLVGAILLFGIFVWVIYLRYLLATKTIESKTEIEKQKLLLTYQGDAAKQIAWESEDQPQENMDSSDAPIEAKIVSEG